MEQSKALLEAQALACGVPEHDIDSIINYVMEGIPMGDFLTAVFENDLMEAFGRADALNALNMHRIVEFIYCYLPSKCHGSPEKVRAWIASFEPQLQQESTSKED